MPGLRWMGAAMLGFLPSLLWAQAPPSNLEEKWVAINPNAVNLKRVESRWQLFSNDKFIKDFGSSEREASQAVRLIRELNLTQYASIPGSQPAFEYWLSDKEAPKPAFATRTVIPFNLAQLKLDQVAGAWCLRDQQQVLYNFGTDVDNAKRALLVCKKYGFNELGVIGNPPLMTYLLSDSYQNLGKPQQQTPNAVALMGAVADKGLILPNVGYVGSRARLEWRKVEVTRVQNEWRLLHGSETLGRFGVSQTDALIAYRQLQDAKATELCRIGRSQVPLYIHNGKLPVGTPLGVTTISFRPAALKAQAINDNWCVTDGSRVLFELGEQKADAELLMKTLQELQADQIWEVGQPQNGGLRVVSRSK